MHFSQTPSQIQGSRLGAASNSRNKSTLTSIKGYEKRTRTERVQRNIKKKKKKKLLAGAREELKGREESQRKS